MRKFLDKTITFVKFHREYFISAAIIFVMFNLALAMNANWPYGDTTPFVSDSFQQVLPISEHIFSVFRGESTLFYTNHIGGGLEIFSTIEYMLFNPFYLLILIGGSKNIVPMFTFSWLLMLIFNAVVFVWFAKKYFKNLSSFFTIMLSLLYVFSGYIVQTYSFVTWQIFPALILLVIDGFLRLVNDGKMVRFIVFLSWFVINCFSVGVSTAIMLFIILSAYIFFMFDKSQRKQVYTKFFVALVISVLVCVAVLFPSIVAFFEAARTGSVLQNLLVKKNHSFLFKISIIFADSIAIFLSVLYFIKNRARQKIDKFFLACMAVVFIPTLFDSCQKLLSGSNYQGFASRFYFINEALIFILSMKYLNEYKPESNEKKSNGLISTLFFATLGVIALVELVFCILSYRTIGGLNKNQGAENKRLFFENFAVFFIILIFLIGLWLCTRKKLFSAKIAKIGFSILMVLSLVFNYVGFFGGGKSNNNLREDVQLLTTKQEVSGKIKFIGMDILPYAANTITSANNVSIFSSLTSREVIEANKLLGRVTSTVYVNSTSGDIITDAVSGISYYYSLTPLNRPYLTFVAKTDDIYLYKNELALTGALGLTASLEDVKTNSDLISALQKQTGQSGDILFDVGNELEIKEENDGTKTYTFLAASDGIFYISAEISKIDDTKIKYNVQMVDEDACQELVFLKAGETYEFNLKQNSKHVDLSLLKFRFLDYEKARDLVLALKPYCAEFEYTKNGYTVKTDFEENRFVYVFAPSISGLSYSVNGKKINDYGKFSGMAYFEAKAGENTFTAKYEYKYANLWIIVVAIALFLILAITILYHYTKFRHISGVITIAIYVVNCCFITLFYFLGVILSFIGFSL